MPHPLRTTLLAVLSALTVAPLAWAQSAPCCSAAQPIYMGAGEAVYDLEASRGGVLELSLDAAKTRQVLGLHQALPSGTSGIVRIEGTLSADRPDGEQPAVTFTLSDFKDGKTFASFINLTPGTWTLELTAYDGADRAVRIPLSDEQARIEVKPFAVAERRLALQSHAAYRSQKALH